MRILIDSKKTTLVGYDEYSENVNEQIESSVGNTHKNLIINFLTIKKPFYRIINYYIYLMDTPVYYDYKKLKKQKKTSKRYSSTCYK